jgi:DNA polymerase-4
MSHYADISRLVFSVFHEFSPLVEGLSLDEAFLDVTESRKLLGTEEVIARDIKSRIRAQSGLTASVGVAPNKLLAKIASDLEKPDGLVVITEQNARAILDPLPAQVIPGIGRETLAKLGKFGIKSIGDLRLAPDSALRTVFGRFSSRMRDRASGIDDRPVVAMREEKSISAEETFDADLVHPADMYRELLNLADKTSARLRKKELLAGTLQVKIREADFSTCTRQRALRPPTSGTDHLYDAARQLLATWLAENPGARIRLLGVGGSELSTAVQQDLFATPETVESPQLDRAIDGIRERFGSLSLGRARTLNRP